MKTKEEKKLINKKNNDKNRDYRQEYAKTHYKSVIVRFKKDDKTDEKLYSHLKKQDSANQYIKDLVEEDIKR